MALTSDHWPNFCDVFVNVMFGVIVLLITACMIERKRKMCTQYREKIKDFQREREKNIFRERERERNKKMIEWNVRRVQKQLEKKCEVKME